ncbi:MAG: acyl-CoA desaturase [Minisyncoccota bacterium]
MTLPQALSRQSTPNVAERSVVTFLIFAPFVAFIVSFFVWNSFVVMSAMVQVVAWYFITVLAITVSFHRELTHRSVTLHPVARYILAFFALFSVEGTIKDWCARHRKHHEHTDDEEDPHSPHSFGSGVFGVVRGFFHAHCGWIFSASRPDYNRYIPDLLKDKGLMVLDKLFPLIAVSSFILPGFITFAFEPSLKGFFAGIFWGGFVRIFMVHHVTWSINSVCHLWGTRPFESKDESTNNKYIALLSAGEAWHRNHHAFPWSARLGLRPWEIDWGWMAIRVLDFFGLVRKIKVPTLEQIEAKRIDKRIVL